MVQRIFEVASVDNNIAAILEMSTLLTNGCNDVELAMYEKNLTLKLLTERNKVFYDVLCLRPVLYFLETCDTKRFFKAQATFLSVNIIEEIFRVLLSTSLPVFDL